MSAFVSTIDSMGHPEIPWRSLIGMRNRLIHAINLDVVWQTVSEDLPTLIAVLEKIPSLKKKSGS